MVGADGRDRTRIYTGDTEILAARWVPAGDVAYYFTCHSLELKELMTSLDRAARHHLSRYFRTRDRRTDVIAARVIPSRRGHLSLGTAVFATETSIVLVASTESACTLSSMATLRVPDRNTTSTDR